MFRKITIFILLIFSSYANAQQTFVPEVNIVMDTKTIQSGIPFTAGIHFKIPEDSHIYWQNPGNSGLPTTIEWILPNGFTAGHIQWPYPEKFESPGDVTYGYEKEVVLMTEITPPSNLNPGDSVDISAKVDWLLCANGCIPGDINLTVKIPVDHSAIKSAESTMINDWESRLPQEFKNWKPEVSVHRGVIELTFHSPEKREKPINFLNVFPVLESLIDPNEKQNLLQVDNQFIIQLKISKYISNLPETFNAVIVLNYHNKTKAFLIDVPLKKS